MEMEDLISPDSIDGVLGYDCIERLMEIESDLMDFSSMNQLDNMNNIGLESYDFSAMLGHGDHEFMTQESQEIDGNECSLLIKELHEEVVMEELSLEDLLLMGAEAVDAKNWSLSFNIIAKLKGLMVFDGGENSFNRIALFFTEGLYYKSINGGDSLQHNHPGNVSRELESSIMSSFQVLQELSPYVKFAHFTANQAILEATEGDEEIHVIDFDIMEGSQWPPLMVDLVRLKKNASLKITAIFDHENQSNVHAIVQQTGRRLKEFADSINLSFEFNQRVVISKDDFDSIELENDHALVGNCIIHQLHMPNRSFSLVKTFLDGISKLSPKMIVLVEEELFNFTKIPSMSFTGFFREALHHYSALSDSLASSFQGRYNVGLKSIEKDFLGIRIIDSLSQFPCENEERVLWENGFASLRRFRPIPLSSCNVSQANFLVSLFSGGYWVQHEKCKLTLCWKSRPLTTASVWVPKLSNPV